MKSLFFCFFFLWEFPDKEDEDTICFKMLSGMKQNLSHARIGLFWGFYSIFPTKISFPAGVDLSALGINL